MPHLDTGNVFHKVGRDEATPSDDTGTYADLLAVG